MGGGGGMKKQSVFLWLVPVLTILVLLSAGCSGEKTSTTITSSSEQQVSTTSVTTTNITTTSESVAEIASSTTGATTQSSPDTAEANTLADLFAKAQGLSMKYTVEISQAGGLSGITQTVWQKGNKVKTESSISGVDTIQIVDMDKQVAYTISNGIATKIDLSGGPEPDTPQADLQSALQYKPVITGTEPIDGNMCTVVELTVNQAKEKIWVWQEHGVPLRLVSTTPQGEVTVNFKDYDFSDIPDSEFELPAGIQVIEPGEIPTMPGTIPSGLPTTMPAEP